MRYISPTILILTRVSGTLADLLGPRYPVPLDLTSTNSLVTAAWENITNTFNSHINGSARSPLLAGIENITFSVGAFSIHDPVARSLQFHHAATEVRDGKFGVRQVDGDSIYRVASVTKVFTAFAGMLELTEEQWNRPLSQILPELATASAQYARQDSRTTISPWDKITPWALVNQLSGVNSNAIPFSPGDLYQDFIAAQLTNTTSAADPSKSGLPPVDFNATSSTIPCLLVSDLGQCNSPLYAESVSTRAPTFLPWTSPAYSNNGFILLGLALSKLTGKDIHTLYRESIFQPLGLASTFSSSPLNYLNRSVIVGPDPISSTFNTSEGIAIPSGGLFSTINDLAKFSTGVLNSTLLSPEMTRKWMKPHSHSADLQFSVGGPWEIVRYVHPSGTASANTVTDLYTKLGDSGLYGGMVVLIPDYGAGFNLICGSSNVSARSQYMQLALDGVVRSYLPALEAEAARESSANYAGTYVFQTPNLNSSMTLAWNSSIPGLSVTQWISNGTDILNIAARFYQTSGKIRLLPAIAEVGANKQAFRIRPTVNQVEADAAAAVGPFTRQQRANGDWINMDVISYAGIATDLVIFDVNGSGNATAVEVPAFKARLRR